MIICQVPGLIIRQSYDLCQKQNLGKRGDGSDGTKMHQLAGVICQNAILFAYGQPLMQAQDMHDGGQDIMLANQIVDIKSTRIDKPVREFHTQSVPEAQLRFNTQIYLFCAIDLTTMYLTVTGWLDKESFLDKATLHKKGEVSTMPNGVGYVNRMTTYNVKVADLRSDFDDWDDLAMQIETYSIYQ